MKNFKKSKIMISFYSKTTEIKNKNREIEFWNPNFKDNINKKKGSISRFKKIHHDFQRKKINI